MRLGPRLWRSIGANHETLHSMGHGREATLRLDFRSVISWRRLLGLVADLSPFFGFSFFAADVAGWGILLGIMDVAVHSKTPRTVKT
jgi:hypothetical protein